MKAILKNNYGIAEKGSKFPIKEIQGKRITLTINGANVDFGISEVDIIESFEMGRFFHHLIHEKYDGLVMNNTLIGVRIKELGLQKINKIIHKSINMFMYG